MWVLEFEEVIGEHMVHWKNIGHGVIWPESEALSALNSLPMQVNVLPFLS